MIKNFFNVFFRNILRQKIYSIINISGLAIGLACFILITIFILHELSYDRFFTKADDIQRLVVKMKLGERKNTQAWTAAPTGAACREEIPEIIEFVRIEKWDDILFRYEDEIY